MWRVRNRDDNNKRFYLANKIFPSHYYVTWSWHGIIMNSYVGQTTVSWPAPPQPVQIFRVQPGTGPGHILLKRSQANVTRLQTKTVAFDIISVDTKLSSKYSLVLRGPSYQHLLSFIHVGCLLKWVKIVIGGLLIRKLTCHNLLVSTK